MLTPKNQGLRNSEYYDMVETFDSLYADSNRGKIFTKLMDIIISEENIMLAYQNMKRNAGSGTAGTDGLTIKDIEKLKKDEIIQGIRNRLNNYQPKAVRRVEIPKPNGNMRPLGIPCIWDRLIQQAFLQVLEPICEAKFYDKSNGFRPNRSAEHAIAQAMKMIQVQHLHYVVDIDIKGFFENVNHTKLRKQMWTMGIRDKKVLSIINAMLKCPIKMPDGKLIYPEKGTPQGGILSPLLSNIVLNELDWWIASQWENMPTQYPYKCEIKKNGSVNRALIFKSLRRASELKEVFIVRYADDFKLFCNNYTDANKVFIATKDWLKVRLKLEINEEKSGVVNVRKHYSEFLGFKLKAKKKGKKYTVSSHVSNKALKSAEKKLIDTIKRIQHPKNPRDAYLSTCYYNSLVIGLHGYYQYATCVNLDFAKLQHKLDRRFINRLGHKLKRDGTLTEGYIKRKYGNSKMIRFINGQPIIPLGFVKTKDAMHKKRNVNKYTVEGRAEIHKMLGLDLSILRRMMNQEYVNQSIEYMDNRISLYSAQLGKCAVTGKMLEYHEIHCHHKVPKEQGGTDTYDNLIIISKEIHILVHATAEDTIKYYLNTLNLTPSMLNKVNTLRKLANYQAI